MSDTPAEPGVPGPPAAPAGSSMPAPPAPSVSPRKKRSGFKTFLIVLGVIIAVIVVAAGVMVLATEGQRREDRTLEITDVDFSKLPDGTYRGSYAGWNRFAVLATVVDGTVTDITIAEDSPNPANAVTDEVLKRVVGEQTLDLDTVSGATVTTKGLLKAVEDALVSQNPE